MKKLLLLSLITAGFSMTAASAELVERNFAYTNYKECGHPTIAGSHHSVYGIDSYSNDTFYFGDYPVSGNQLTVYDNSPHIQPPLACREIDNNIAVISNYRPEVRFTHSEENKWPGGTNRVTFTAFASDVDGDITKYEWWVNGTKHTSTTRRLVITTQRGGDYVIKVRVTDNGTIENKPYVSGEPTVKLNQGEPMLILSESEEKLVNLLPYSCTAPCTPW